jgi:hypothetical protein
MSPYSASSPRAQPRRSSRTCCGSVAELARGQHPRPPQRAPERRTSRRPSGPRLRIRGPSAVAASGPTRGQSRDPASPVRWPRPCVSVSRPSPTCSSGTRRRSALPRSKLGMPRRSGVVRALSPPPSRDSGVRLSRSWRRPPGPRAPLGCSGQHANAAAGGRWLDLIASPHRPAEHELLRAVLQQG